MTCVVKVWEVSASVLRFLSCVVELLKCGVKETVLFSSGDGVIEVKFGKGGIFVGKLGDSVLFVLTPWTPSFPFEPFLVSLSIEPFPTDTTTVIPTTLCQKEKRNVQLIVLPRQIIPKISLLGKLLHCTKYKKQKIAFNIILPHITNAQQENFLPRYSLASNHHSQTGKGCERRSD